MVCLWDVSPLWSIERSSPSRGGGTPGGTPLYCIKRMIVYNIILVVREIVVVVREILIL